jgi:UDP-N-acetylmuramoyl-tripeptide--D-alanyl-D-alanine ligase
MANLTLDFLRENVGEHALPSTVDPDAVFTSITNDSRVAEPGALFLALEAERDGHDFIADARARGAAGVLARRVVPLPESDQPFAYVVVPDPIRALQNVAKAHRDRLSMGRDRRPGSVGKTSTKEAIAHVLRRRHKVLSSPGNFNNEIGMPIALLDADWEHDRAVLEMGAYAIGEIAELCRVAQPEVGVVTTVGTNHLESFGSMEAIERGKGELVEALPSTGLAVLNGDDPRVRWMATRASCPVVFYGEGEANAVQAIAIRSRGLDGIAFTLQVPGGSAEVETRLIGRHQIYPCLAAASVAMADEMEPEQIASALGELAPTRLRLRPRQGRNGATILTTPTTPRPCPSSPRSMSWRTRRPAHRSARRHARARRGRGRGPSPGRRASGQRRRRACRGRSARTTDRRSRRGRPA